MSRKGNYLDNPIMENFFKNIKNEIFYGKGTTFRSFVELEHTISKYICYNNYRITEKLKGLNPVQYRNQSLLTN